MTRQCDVCGTTYTAKRATSRYCGATCRTRASRAGVAAAVVPVKPQPPRILVESTVDAIRAELDAANALDSAAGRIALALATLIDGSTVATGSAAATLAKECRAALAEAKQSAPQVVADPLDELEQRRARRGA
jgi:uncharacterized OB-fold protein